MESKLINIDLIKIKLKKDPNFVYCENTPEHQALIIVNGRGDCCQCGGWGCIDCHFTGEEKGYN